MGRTGHRIFVCDSAVGAISVTRVTGAQPPSSTCKAVQITTGRCRKKGGGGINNVANAFHLV
jgi:hypothetical protein